LCVKSPPRDTPFPKKQKPADPRFSHQRRASRPAHAGWCPTSPKLATNTKERLLQKRFEIKRLFRRFRGSNCPLVSAWETVVSGKDPVPPTRTVIKPRPPNDSSSHRLAVGGRLLAQVLSCRISRTLDGFLPPMLPCLPLRGSASLVSLFSPRRPAPLPPGKSRPGGPQPPMTKRPKESSTGPAPHARDRTGSFVTNRESKNHGVRRARRKSARWFLMHRPQAPRGPPPLSAERRMPGRPQEPRIPHNRTTGADRTFWSPPGVNAPGTMYSAKTTLVQVSPALCLYFFVVCPRGRVLFLVRCRPAPEKFLGERPTPPRPAGASRNRAQGGMLFCRGSEVSGAGGLPPFLPSSTARRGWLESSALPPPEPSAPITEMPRQPGQWDIRKAGGKPPPPPRFRRTAIGDLSFRRPACVGLLPPTQGPRARRPDTSRSRGKYGVRNWHNIACQAPQPPPFCSDDANGGDLCKSPRKGRKTRPQGLVSARLQSRKIEHNRNAWPHNEIVGPSLVPTASLSRNAHVWRVVAPLGGPPHVLPQGRIGWGDPLSRGSPPPFLGAFRHDRYATVAKQKPGADVLPTHQEGFRPAYPQAKGK